MEKESRQPLLLEHMACWCGIQLREYKVPLTASFILGMLAYMFAFTNKLVNHDEVHCLFSKGATVTSGRWGLGLLDGIFPNCSMPWIYGMITIALIAVSVCLIIGMFQIRSRLLQVLLAGSIMVFPSLIGTFGYMFTSSSYALSFLLAVLAVWFLRRGRKFDPIPALVCMVASLSIYQSYIAVAASLLVLVLIQQLLKENQPVTVIRRGCFFVAFLIFSLGLYYLASQIVFRITGTTFSNYAQDSITFSISTIPGKIFLAYSNFLLFFATGTPCLVPTEFSQLAHLLCVAAIGILLVLWCFRQTGRNGPRFILLFALVGILPLAINCMYLITSEESIHTLVLYGFVAVYILATILVDESMESASGKGIPQFLRKAALEVATLAISVVILINIYIANAAYLNLHLRYENAYAFYTSLLADIKIMPEFQEGTKIAIAGHWKNPDYYYENLEFTYYLTGIYGFAPDNYSNEAFLKYYIGTSLPFASAEEIAKITASPEYADMAVYPYYGSMQMFGDVLVVKLS